MEGTHGQLGTRLTDGLCRDDSDRLTYLHGLSGRHVGAVALRAHADMRFTGQNGTDFQRVVRISILIHAILDDGFRAFRRA